MGPLATEPFVVLASASPIVGELLGEKRIVVGHSATGYASDLGECRHQHGPRSPPAKPDGPVVRSLYGRDSRTARKLAHHRLGSKVGVECSESRPSTRTVASMRPRDDR